MTTPFDIVYVHNGHGIAWFAVEEGSAQIAGAVMMRRGHEFWGMGFQDKQECRNGQEPPFSLVSLFFSPGKTRETNPIESLFVDIADNPMFLSWIVESRDGHLNAPVSIADARSQLTLAVTSSLEKTALINETKKRPTNQPRSQTSV